MVRFRLSRPAQGDLARILETSGERWGDEGRRRYAATIATAIRAIATDPGGALIRQRGELSPGLCSFHIRHARPHEPKAKVKRPVHVIYFRAVEPDLIEIVRVLHERMEPSRHIGAGLENEE